MDSPSSQEEGTRILDTIIMALYINMNQMKIIIITKIYLS
jgi:hypothetical protein